MNARPGSWHVRELPANWPELREACFARDGYSCRWPVGGTAGDGRPLVCGSGYQIEADHVNRFGPDELWNLQTLCRIHHKAKSSGEGGRAAGEIRKRIAASRVRAVPRHPGLRQD